MGLHVRAPRKPDDLEHKLRSLETVLPTEQPEKLEEVTVEPSFDVSEDMKPFRLSFHSWTEPDANSKSAEPNRSTHEVFASYREDFLGEVQKNPQLFKKLVKIRRDLSGMNEMNDKPSTARSVLTFLGFVQP